MAMQSSANRFGASNFDESPDFSTSKFFVGGWSEKAEAPAPDRLAGLLPTRPKSARSDVCEITEERPRASTSLQNYLPLPPARRSIASSTTTASSVKRLLQSSQGSESESSVKSNSKLDRLDIALALGKIAGCARSCNKAPQETLKKCTTTLQNQTPSGCFSSTGSVAPVRSSTGSRPLENLQMLKLWADKHHPENLSSFVIHKDNAHFLKQLISGGNCHNLIIQGSPGSGKKTVVKALLRELFGPAAWNVAQEMKSFDLQGRKVVVPIVLSAHHVELNTIHVVDYAKHMIATLLKEMQMTCEMAVPVANSGFIDYKVLVLHNADKLPVDSHQNITWLMDRYADHCKVIFCCEEPIKQIENLQTRCAVVNLRSPTTDDVVEVLQFVAERERFKLPDKFASRIAKSSKNNLRQAVLSLEACKLNQYPFEEDQRIITGWEDEVAEIAHDIVEEQTHKRLHQVRERLSRLLQEGVAPKIIHKSLVEELVKLVDAPLKVEVYQWAKFYARKLPDGNDAIFKLEEFIAKLMSIYKKLG